MVYSQDGTKIASGSGDKTLKIWNAQTGQCVSTRGYKKIQCVAFSPDGKILAAGDDGDDSYCNGGGSVRLYDTVTGDVKSTLSGHSGYVTAVSYSCSFSNAWCVLTIEYCTGLSGVFASVQTAKTLLVEAWTKP